MLRDSLSQGATRAKLANHHKKKQQRATLMTKWLITAHYKSVRVCARVCPHINCILSTQILILLSKWGHTTSENCLRGKVIV